VNFNHLIDERSLKRKCKKANSECYYIPAGNIRATQGENVHMTMVCKKCGVREDIFLTKKQYDTQERLIKREIGNV